MIDKKEKKYLKDAANYIKSNEFDLALGKCNEVIGLNNRNSRAFCVRAHCLSMILWHGDLRSYLDDLYDLSDESDINEFEGCSRDDGELESFFEYRIKCDYTEAINLAEKKQRSMFYTCRGLFYQRIKETQLAINDFSEVINITCNNAKVYRLRGLCYLDDNKYKLAFNDFDIFMKNASDKDKNNLIDVGMACANSGKYDMASHYIKSAFKCIVINEEESLKLRVYLDYIEKSRQLDDSNNELNRANKELKINQRNMRKLVEQFTHSLGNIIFPETAYRVMDELKKNSKYRKESLLLYDVYRSEKLIKRQGEILRQRYTNKDPEKFRQLIRSCRRRGDDINNNVETIEAILNHSVSHVITRFFNKNCAELNEVRNKVLTDKKVNIEDLKKKFEDIVLINNTLSPLEWSEKYLRNIKIDEFSPAWKGVCVLSESYTESLLFGYFSEILFNAYKYADHDNNDFLRISFTESVINGDVYLSCSWENPIIKIDSPEEHMNDLINANADNYLSLDSALNGSKGLEAIKEDLKQLNNTKKQEESLLIDSRFGKFKISLFFIKELLINDLPIIKVKIRRKND